MRKCEGTGIGLKVVDLRKIWEREEDGRAGKGG